MRSHGSLEYWHGQSSTLLRCQAFIPTSWVIFSMASQAWSAWIPQVPVWLCCLSTTPILMSNSSLLPSLSGLKFASKYTLQVWKRCRHLAPPVAGTQAVTFSLDPARDTEPHTHLTHTSSPSPVTGLGTHTAPATVDESRKHHSFQHLMLGPRSLQQLAPLARRAHTPGLTPVAGTQSTYTGTPAACTQGTKSATLFLHLELWPPQLLMLGPALIKYSFTNTSTSSAMLKKKSLEAFVLQYSSIRKQNKTKKQFCSFALKVTDGKASNGDIESMCLTVHIRQIKDKHSAPGCEPWNILYADSVCIKVLKNMHEVSFV